MMLENYITFYKRLVLRKRSDLLNPKYHNISEVRLPKDSAFIFIGEGEHVIGPDNNERFIGNYPDIVNIEFKEDGQFPIGKIRNVVIDRKKMVNNYFKGHYKYKRVRNPGNVLGLSKQLYVVNMASALQGKRYVPNRFVNFEKAYNRFATLIHGIKDAYNLNSGRKLFIHLPLPPNLPSWQNFLIGFNAYKECFENDYPTLINNKAIAPFKAYGHYWLMDLYAFLLGEYEYSQFNKLTEEELNYTTVIFSYNSKAFLVNLGLLKEWFDETSGDKKPKSLRINATKRFILALLNMINSGNEIITKEGDYADGEGEDQTEGTADTGEDTEGEDAEEEDTSGNININSLDDLFSEPKATNKTINKDGETKRNDTFNESDKQHRPQRVESSSEDEEVAGEWTDEVDDQLLEEVPVDEIELTTKPVFTSPISGIELALEERIKNGSLTVAERDFFLRKANSYKTIKMPNGETLAEFIKYDEEKLRGLDGKLQIDALQINDKSMLSAKATELKLGYIDKFLKKDIANTILSFQNAGICVTGLETETIVNAEGSYDVYKIKLLNTDGVQSVAPVRFPTVLKDGTFVVDGVRQVQQLTKMEIPIRKINERTVALTSHYDRKLMVERSSLVRYDYSLSIAKQIKAKNCNEDLTYILGNVYDKGIKAPRYFSMMASKFKMLTTGDYVFNFDTNKLNTQFPGVEKTGNENVYPIGTYQGKLLYIDQFGMLICEGKNITSFEEAIGIKPGFYKKAPIDAVTISINGVDFPIGVVLSYYFGIDNLLKVLGIEYQTVPVGEKVNVTEDEFYISFSDEHLVFNRRDMLACFVFGAFKDLPNLGNFSRFDCNSQGVWLPIMGNPKVKPSHFKEMKLLFDMFIDPITRKELEAHGYPTDFHYLLIEAVKLLLTDYSKHEVAITEQRFVGYEKFAGHLYREMVKSVRQMRAKEGVRGNKLDMNPEAVITSIVTDTSINLVEEVNPLHEIKSQEEATFGGTGGRSEDTMVRRTRGQQMDFIGVVSEAGKDSGKVGFVHYITSDPKIVDYRGNVNVDLPTTNTGLLSVIGNTYFGSTKDDPKRALYSGTQASQVLAATNYVTNCIRTGYEVVIAHRTSELYSKVAKQNGKVTKVDKFGIKVVYEDGTEDGYPLGLYIGEAAGEKHRHTRVTDLKVGDTFKQGTVIGWDEQYFERDLISPDQVSIKWGALVRIALTENQFTFEDSFKISKELAEQSKSYYIKPKRFTLDFTDTIKWKKGIGDEVDYEEILCEVEAAHISDIEEEDPFGEFDGLDRLGMGIRQIKANHHGKIISIETIYNGSVQDMSPSLQELVGKSDKERAAINRYTQTGVVNGDIGNNSNLKKVPINPGKVQVTIYIEDLSKATTADKFVLGNQMKGTVSFIFNEPMLTTDGRVVDGQFSCKSMYKRMVVSLRDKMAANELLHGVSKQFVDLYRNR